MSFESLVGTDTVKQLLTLNDQAGTEETETVADLLRRNADTLLGAAGDARAERERELLDVAVSSLDYFVQNNWTGPPGKLDPATLVPERLQGSLSQQISTYLESDGEAVYELASHPLCLLIARVLLERPADLNTGYEPSLWLLRCCHAHQQLLSERSPSLKQLVMILVEKLHKSEELKKNSSVHLEFLLESCHLSLFYYEYKLAAELLNEASDVVQIRVEMIGLMGKRTKFQETKVAQLVCRITRKTPETGITQPDHVLPKDLPLNSEVLLERPQLDDDTATPEADIISPVEAAYILTKCLHKRRTQASSNIEEEETSAFIEALVRYRCSWSVLSKVLSVRSVLEKRKPKRFERSLGQLEELVHQFRHPQPPAECRLPTIYASQMAPIWHTEKELAHLYLSFGSTDTALEIFLKLRLWPEVIECYAHLGRLEKAESVIRERLRHGETPDLLCYLGDVTDDMTCYARAWQLSKGRSARAQRSWALKLFYQGRFEESIEHFEKSLSINHLQAGLWFTFGCACMAVQELTKAITAFRRCVTLEYDNYQAWTNLSACLAKSNDKPGAFRLLDDALKCNYENGRIWENYVVFGLDCGEFESVIRGYHRLMDLKDKFVDVQILTILVKVVNEGMADAQGNSAGRLRPKLQELLGRQTATVTSDPGVWKLYGDLVSHQNSTVDNKAEKAIQHYQKYHRCLAQKDDYLTDPVLAADILKKTDELVKVYLGLVDLVSSPAQAVQMMASVKLSAQNLITKVKSKHRTLMDELVPELVEPCSNLESSLQSLKDRISALN